MDKLFLGRGWKFPVEVDSTTGRIMMSEYEEDIAEAVKVIIWTGKGERVMRSDFGCGINRFVFDTTDNTNLHLMESSIREALRDWEPRIHEIEVEAAVDPKSSGRVNIHVQYRVRTTNNLYNQVYPFYIQEGAK